MDVLIRKWGGTILSAPVQLLKTILASGAYIVGLVVVPIFAYFFLTDAESIRKGVARHLPPQTRPQFHSAIQDIDCTLRAWVRTIMVVAVLTGVTTGLVLLFTGVPAYLPLGILTGLGAMVPVLGPIVAMTITMIVSLLTVGLGRSLLVLAIYGGIELASDRILAPKLMAEGMNLHPVAVIIALMVGGQFFGVIGVFVAVPVLSALRLLYIHASEYLSDDEHRREIDDEVGPKDADEEE